LCITCCGNRQEAKVVKQSETEAERRSGDRRQISTSDYTGPERRKSDRRTLGTDAPTPAKG
jgi:hypothetical protein